MFSLFKMFFPTIVCFLVAALILKDVRYVLFRIVQKVYYRIVWNGSLINRKFIYI